MNAKTILILVLVFVLNIISVFGQKTASIKNIDFQLLGDKLIITYDIVNYKFSDKFNVIPEIKKASGVKIDARSFTGDLNNVQGGPAKKITWDLTKDNITLDEDIYVDLFGSLVVEEAIVKPKEKVPQTGAMKTPPEKPTNLQPVSRTACFFESVLFPGWGSSRLTLKNGHFLKGIIGYGAVIGSIACHSESTDSYNAYKGATSTTERDDNFSKAEKFNKISNYLAGGAAAIWTVDLITVLVVKNKTVNQKTSATRISLGYTMACANTHQLVIRLNF
jgi:hypothetical protein